MNFVKPISENSGKIKHKLSNDRIGIFWRFFGIKSEDNIPNICWACNKTLSYENSDTHLYQNYFLLILKKTQKCQKFVAWIGLNILRCIMPKT